MLIWIYLIIHVDYNFSFSQIFWRLHNEGEGRVHHGSHVQQERTKLRRRRRDGVVDTGVAQTIVDALTL